MLCPKCHRPLADDAAGPSLCCAGESRRWRCTACAKVSEGFALPYGRCPQCGGTLEVVESPRAPAGAALDGIRMAFEIELGGRAFYQRAAAQSTDPALRQLFARFALMEGEHMETLARRYHLDVPPPSPWFRVEVAAIFGEVQSRPQDPANLFRIAIALEKRAADFFAERSERGDAEAAEQALYRELAAEERAHADLLAAEYAHWRAGTPGRFAGDLIGALPEAGTGAGALLNAAHVLLAAGEPAACAIACGDERLSYEALRERAARAASAWKAHGVTHGDRVAIRLADGIDWVVAFLGAIWAGGVAVAVNPRIPPAEWHYVLDEAGFSAILCDDAGDGDTVQDTPPPWHERIITLADWRRAVGAAEPCAPEAMDGAAPAFWCHSSGTSGKPKAVVHGHRFARAIELVSRDGIGVRRDDRLLASSKLFFAYPLTNALFAGLKLGATVILDAQWPTAPGLLATIEAQHPTVLFSVPSLYRNLLHEGLAPRIAAAGVRLCVSAGEALPARLRDEWSRQTGMALLDGYGASEALVLVMLDRGDGTGFTASPGVEIAPLGEVAAGTPTRLLIRAPTLALGYLDRPQAQAEAFRDGGFSPADLFVRIDDGAAAAAPPRADAAPAPCGRAGWRFAGREDSLVKIHGRWVDLVALEQVLAARTPRVVEAAAVSVPDDDGVDAVALFYVASGTDAAAGEALSAAAATLPPHQRPRWLHPVTALPRTPTGKLLRRSLQELHRSLA